MLKPNDKWCWYFDKKESSLMLDLSDEMVFKTRLPAKVLIDDAFQKNVFSVEDANAFEYFSSQIRYLGLSEGREAELTLSCVAAKHFYKPVQPQSWFFDRQHNNGYVPEEGDIIRLLNQYGSGYFIAIDVNDSSTLCVHVDLDGFSLSSSKILEFAQVIKVMHDRLICANHLLLPAPVALVG